SSNLTVLPGTGGGFFNDLNLPPLLATGLAPVQTLIGNFDGLPGLDLLSINSGSNNLTLFSGLGAGVNLSLAGIRPVAGIAGDFNGDGLDDVLLANNGNGVISLLLGQASGLALLENFTDPSLQHPTALALSVEHGFGVTFYVTDEGQEMVVRFRFQ